MDQLLLEKKNKQNMERLNSIIHDYENKLDQRVSQVIAEMMSYTKRIADPQVLPILRDKKVESQNHKITPYYHRNKTSSQHAELSFLSSTSLDAEISHLRNTFKEAGSTKLIPELGRSVGNRSIAKPKFTRKKPDILPRQMRLNPLYERNAIKAYQLDKGVMSLLEKGKIGKDVNIITAFEKGRPVLQTQKAIFHQGEERFAELQQEKEEQASHNVEKEKKIVERNELRERIFEESWALTMPKDDLSTSKVLSSSLPHRQVKPLQVQFKEKLYIKIQLYKVQEDSSYKQAVNKHLAYKGQIVQILHAVSRLMKNHSIQIGYIDVAKILQYVTKANKLYKSELFDCITGFNRDSSRNSLKQVKGQQQKYQLALDKVISSLKLNLERKQFLQYMKKKKIANRIYGWAVSCWTVRKSRELMRKRRQYIEQQYEQLQRIFRLRYEQIQKQKHYEIHLINEQMPTKTQYRDLMNIQITKIFNIRNINKYIIYLLPHALDDETINYYYKIMELQEIPNYKERVCFIQVDPQGIFNPRLSLTSRLYYHSSTLRHLQKKVKDVPAYFTISYPEPLNIDLAVYLNIPILSASLKVTQVLEKKTKLTQLNQQILDMLVIESGKHSTLFSLSDQIGQYCENNKRVKKYVVKINGQNKSKGIALLTAPFTSLPQMYSNTALIHSSNSVDQFYHRFLKYGGVIQKYQERVSFVGAVLQISTQGEVKVVGTYEKISSGFVNIAYIFPQKKVEHKLLEEISIKVGANLASLNHLGTAELTFVVNNYQGLFLEKVQCYSTHLTSALNYYKFLSDGHLQSNGDYMAKIIDTFDNEGKEQEVVTYEPRSFCYVPFLLHFGLSERQANSFFQLCRMGGVSFDLQSKYGATFILLGSIKSAMGLITTAKDRKGGIKLMVKSLQFILKQNSSNMSSSTLAEKQVRMKERENILNVKERLESL